MFKENVITGEILFCQYKYVHSSLTHLNVQVWMQYSKGLVCTFSFLKCHLFVQLIELSFMDTLKIIVSRQKGYFRRLFESV